MSESIDYTWCANYRVTSKEADSGEGCRSIDSLVDDLFTPILNNDIFGLAEVLGIDISHLINIALAKASFDDNGTLVLKMIVDKKTENLE